MPGPLTIETHPGQPIRHGDLRLTPFAQSWRLQVPGSRAWAVINLIWTRPTALLVSYPDGRESVLPVKDPTRRIIWTLLGISLAAALLNGIIGKRSRRQP